MYVKVRDGVFLNLEAASTAKLGQVSTRGVRPIVLRDDNNNEIGVARDLDLESLTAPVVPAASVPVLCIDHAGNTRWSMIVAWRIVREHAEPIFAGARPPGIMFIVGADGALVGMGQRYGDLEEALAAVRAAGERE